MSLSGTFASMSPSDLLQMLSWGSKTGLLTCNRQDQRRHVFIHNGAIVGVTSSRYKDRLGALLLRLNYITDEQFSDIFGRQASNGRPLGEIFMSENLLAEKDLESVLRYQVEEITYDLLSWGDGEFAFEERSLSKEENRIEGVEISNLLLEGARRMDEINRLRSEFQDKDIVLKLKDDVDLTGVDFNRSEQVVSTQLFTSQSLEELLKMVNETEYDLLTSVKSLLDKNIIEEDKAASEKRRESQQKIEKLLDLTRTMESKGWHHEALSNVHEVLKFEPESEEALDIKNRLRKEIIRQAKIVFGAKGSIPSVRHSVASISVDKLQLNPREGFVFSRIDGRTDVKNLRYLTGMPQDELFIVLHKFIRMGLIYLDESKSNSQSNSRR